ncbi:MAG TPA: FtsX-like permease family protein [Nocardioidaceae bacterium]|nr:FtsX-like permease family protein [Nocardioidaceae bacterium]
MWRVSWRNLVARKVRLLLSGFAIVLGVAFVAGSFIFTDALGGAFDGIIKGSTADVVVQPRGAGDFDQLGQDARTIPGDVVRRLDGLEEAAAVHPTLQQLGVWVIGADGKLVGGNGAPGIALNYSDAEAITGDRILTLTTGELPASDSQILLDEDTADKAGYSVGDQVTLVTPGDNPTVTMELVGLARFGSGDGAAGATLTIFDTASMQRLFFGGRDVFTGASITAADDVSQAQLRDAAAAVLPAGVTAEEGDKVAEEAQASLADDLGFVTTFLLVFAVVSLVVGVFIIVNTFSILVAQRSRELALLRALGASRRQVNRAVLSEAFAVGLVGATVGLVGGYLLAIGLKALFGTFGLDLAGADLPVRGRTIVAAYLVGVVVTMVAAYFPARRAGRIAPVAAMRDDVAMPQASMHRRMIAGSCLIVAGAGLLTWGLVDLLGPALVFVGAGMLGILLGVSLLSAVIGRPLVRAIGRPYQKLYGTVGQLATENSLRNPRRTAATASALMIGLTLVALMSTIGQSAKASTDQIVESSLTANFVVSEATYGTPFTPAIGEQISTIDGVETVAPLRDGTGKVDGEQIYFGATDPVALAKAFDIEFDTGTLVRMAKGAVLIDRATAKAEGYGIGDRLELAMPAGVQKLTVAGIFESSAAMPYTHLTTLETLRKGGVKPADSKLYITTAEGADKGVIRDQIDAITEDLPTVVVYDPEEFAEATAAQINQFLYFIYALLALALVIAVLGVVNTLALSVIERTREIGLLRAVGMSRRQLRRMVRLESVAIASLGAVLGVGMGLVFAVALQRAIADEGFDVLAIPWGQLALFVVIAAVLGVLAALLPARRAARLNVLAAITTE